MSKATLGLILLAALLHATPAGAQACDPGNPCPLNFNQCRIFDGCINGSCVYSDRNCDDGDVCTDDSCNANAPGGCVHVPHCGVNTICSDQNICFKRAIPLGGHIVFIAECVNEGPPNCDDNDVCTTDHCVEPAGCLHDPVPFDDHDVCTLDECDPVAGISHTPLPGCCNLDTECSGDKCTTGKQCVDHSCTGGAAVTCDDGDPCTIDSCNPADGCLTRSRDGFEGLACICDRTPPATCAGATVPRTITKRSTKACKLIATARTADTVHARKLLGRVAVQLKRAKAAVARFGRKAPAGCGQALAAQLGDDEARAQSAEQSL